jgi:hypothetical protein
MVCTREATRAYGRWVEADSVDKESEEVSIEYPKLSAGYRISVRGVKPVATAKRIDGIAGQFLRTGIPSRDNSPLSEWIATVFVIAVISATERILPVFVREAKAL